LSVSLVFFIVVSFLLFRYLTVNNDDEKLFSAMCNWSNHCLHHLLPSERDTGHDLIGVEDILISWFVIILALLGVASLSSSS